MSELQPGRFVRQGDIFIARVAGLPPLRTERLPDPTRGIVLAYGEATGHAHVVRGRTVLHYDAPDAMGAARALLADAGLTVELPEASAPSFLLVEEAPAQVEHNTHTARVLPVGDYVVWHQVEWSDAMEPIQVRD